MFVLNNVSQIENRVFTIYRIFLFISAFGKICFQHFLKVQLSTFLCFDWEFCGHHKREFDVCLWFCDLVHSHWSVSVKYHLQKYNYSVHFGFVRFDSPQINEKTTQVFGGIVDEKRKHFQMILAAKWK